MRVTTFHQPQDLKEALDLLAGSTETTALLAGGTDLIVRKNKAMGTEDTFIAIRQLPELLGIDIEGNNLVLGAGNTHTLVCENPLVQEHLPAFGQAVRLIGSKQIRNMGTLGGNICNASPVADTVCPLIGLSAKVRLVSKEGEREVLLEEFFTGPGATVKTKNEILTHVLVPLPNKNVKQGFSKLGPRKEADIALVNMAAVLEIEGDTITSAKVVFGSVAPTAIRGKGAEEQLVGKKVANIDYEALGKAAAQDVKPISDQRSSLEYRRNMCETLIKDLVAEIVR